MYHPLSFVIYKLPSSSLIDNTVLRLQKNVVLGSRLWSPQPYRYLPFKITCRATILALFNPFELNQQSNRNFFGLVSIIFSNRLLSSGILLPYLFLGVLNIPYF